MTESIYPGLTYKYLRHHSTAFLPVVLYVAGSSVFPTKISWVFQRLDD